MENLASKYRPRNFSEVVAQEYVKEILLNQINSNTIKNAYLFTGGAGTGKTTTARIVAADINKGKGSPIEIDAASNNGVDNIRDIINDSKFKSLDSEYKVYIIDEVHMLSTGAFNALLKTLEEPPSGTVFILCTTDPQKIPSTILSRVQRFDFTRIENEKIVEQLQFIIECENEEAEIAGFWEYITFEDEALDYIAKLANGGMRDSITRLEKVLDYSEAVTLDNVINALGVPDFSMFYEMIEGIAFLEPAKCLKQINHFHMSGKDLKLTMRSFTDFLLEICKYYITQSPENVNLPLPVIEQLGELIEKIPYTMLLWMLESMNEMNSAIKWESNCKPIIEAKFILMARDEND